MHGGGVECPMLQVNCIADSLPKAPGLHSTWSTNLAFGPSVSIRISEQLYTCLFVMHSYVWITKLTCVDSATHARASGSAEIPVITMKMILFLFFPKLIVLQYLSSIGTYLWTAPIFTASIWVLALHNPSGLEHEGVYLHWKLPGA